MPTDDLKRAVHRAIDRRADEIVGLGESIRRHPELGFKEFKTSKLVEETFADYEIVDKALAYVVPAKALASMVIDMLWDGGAAAREVLAQARPPMTLPQYLAFQRGIARVETYEG